MARFGDCLGMVARHEGGFSWDEDDSGGPTNYGISLSALDNLNLDINHDGRIDIDDVRALTYEQAKDIYKTNYWDVACLDDCDDQRVANRVMDIIINTGPGGAKTICTRAFRACSLMDKTFKTFDELIANLNCIDDDILTVSLRSEQAGYYRSLANANKVYEKFLKGWLNRAYDDEF